MFSLKYSRPNDKYMVEVVVVRKWAMFNSSYQGWEYYNIIATCIIATNKNKKRTSSRPDDWTPEGEEQVNVRSR